MFLAPQQARVEETEALQKQSTYKLEKQNICKKAKKFKQQRNKLERWF